MVVSLAVLFISRNGLRDRHSYGYYRFFALEFTLLSVVANLRVWFDDPLSIQQVISWLLLVCSLYLAVSGFRLVEFSRAADGSNPGKLVETGIYSHIRHPLYSSLIFLASAAFFKKPSLFSAILLFGSIYTTAVTATADR
ncbi:MAG: hypothetical protein M1339_06155, partial [Bacteroidetes bacterium]|nr:hypothetical protein [Bacteroidota bacterium]